MLFQKQNKTNKHNPPKPNTSRRSIYYIYCPWIILWFLFLFIYLFLEFYSHTCHLYHGTSRFKMQKTPWMALLEKHQTYFGFAKSQECCIMLPSGSFLRWHSCPPYCMDQVLFHHIHMPLHWFGASHGCLSNMESTYLLF